MLYFLERPRIGAALIAWREAHKLTAADVVAKSKLASKKPVASSTISEIEKHGSGFSYKRLVEDILPAYGIDDIGDFDLFLDYCVNSSLDTIVHIKDKDRGEVPFRGTREYLTNPDALLGNRTRISVIEVEPGQSTLWQRHEGHEYLMISKGTVFAEFAETLEGTKKTFTLKTYDAIAFPSALYHRFENRGSSLAELIVARPTKSLPRGMYDKSLSESDSPASGSVPGALTKTDAS
jgi:mannose-6-phosphate isomerase-like protein (cupin superfamily)